MTRPERPDQTEEEFKLLGHDPYEHYFNIGIGGKMSVIACKKCKCHIGSEIAANPCGDMLGKFYFEKMEKK